MGEFKTIANKSEIPLGQGKIFEIDGNSIAVWNVNGNFYAFQSVCPHRGGPVGEGEMEGNVITCPWHGWSFDVTTGVSPINPAAKLTCYQVQLEGDQIKVDY
jgi:nitrite reductase/ring-hydroxylating ferredoxin subunit